MGIWLTAVIAVAIAAVLGFKAIARRTVLNGRTSRSLEEIYASVSSEVSREVFDEVWSVVGKAYLIDPGLIMPADSFAHFGKMDSWDLGKGEDDIGTWLEQKNLGAPPELHSVIEFAKWVESASGGDRVSG